MTNEIEQLDKAGYRKFGLVTSGIFVVVFGLLIPLLFGLGYPKWPWFLACILSLWALLIPGTLKPVYIGWMKFGNVMNWINTRVILAFPFYGMFMPFGIVMRLLGKDPMQRKIDKKLFSYRIESQKENVDRVEQPY
jgi:hypothetical protein